MIIKKIKIFQVINIINKSIFYIFENIFFKLRESSTDDNYTEGENIHISRVTPT